MWNEMSNSFFTGHQTSEAETSPESLQQGGFTLVQLGLTLENLTKCHWLVVFHISIWGV